MRNVLLWIHAFLELQLVAGTASVSPVHDIVSYPFGVHLLYCTIASPGSSVDYSCSYMCNPSMSSEYVVNTDGSCVNQFSISPHIPVSSGVLPGHKVLSANTLVDESLRYRIGNGGSVFVASCVSAPCVPVSSSFSIFGRI